MLGASPHYPTEESGKHGPGLVKGGRKAAPTARGRYSIFRSRQGCHQAWPQADAAEHCGETKLAGGGDRLIKEQRLRKELDTTKTRTNLEASKRLKLLRLELEAATPGAARWRWRRLSGGARRCFHQAENVGGPSALY